jgi:hypothetical protein
MIKNDAKGVKTRTPLKSTAYGSNSDGDREVRLESAAYRSLIAILKVQTSLKRDTFFTVQFLVSALDVFD